MEVVEIDMSVMEDSMIDNHFTKKLNEDLQQIQNRLYNTLNDQNIPKQLQQHIYRGNDSPLTMSNNNSDDDSVERYSIAISYNENLSQENTRTSMIVPRSSVLSYNTPHFVQSNTSEYDNIISSATAIDVIKTYLYCQKHIYNNSGVITLYKHNSLFGITFTISTSICIFVSFLDSYKWRTTIIIVFNAVITCLLIMMKYLKMDITADLCKHIAYQCDIAINMVDKQTDNINAKKLKLKDLKNKITEIKNIPGIIIPNAMRTLYPICINIDVFTFIKKTEARKIFLIEELCKINKELKYIVKNYPDDKITPREKNRFEYLVDIKNTLKSHLLLAENAYSYIDEIFMREYNEARSILGKYRYFYLGCMISNNFVVNSTRCNSFVDEYLMFIIPKNKCQQ